MLTSTRKHSKKRFSFSDIDAAYAAGLFDGEGSVGLYGTTPTLVIVNTHLGVLEWCRDRWGGNIYEKRQEKGRLRCWRWHLYGMSALPFLNTIRPWVQIKGEQLDLYADIPFVGRGYRRTPEQRARLAEIEQQLKALK